MNAVFREWPSVSQPEPTASLWRYMSMDKFQSFIEEQSIYLCRIDRFDDSFEGALPTRVAEHHSKMFRQLQAPDLLGRAPDSSYLRAQLSARETYRRFFYANCWHVNSHESTAMWQLYLGGTEGLAVKTTFLRMRRAIPVPSDGRLCGGLVSYVDFDRDWFDALGPVDAYFHRRIEYKHECEYRLLYQYFPPDVYPESVRGVFEAAGHIPGSSVRVRPEVLKLDVETKPGVLHRVDLNALLTEVVCSPASTRGLAGKVETLLDKHGFRLRVSRSSLDSIPRFR